MHHRLVSAHREASCEADSIQLCVLAALGPKMLALSAGTHRRRDNIAVIPAALLGPWPNTPARLNIKTSLNCDAMMSTCEQR